MLNSENGKNRIKENNSTIVSAAVVMLFSIFVAVSMLFYIQDNYAGQSPTFIGHIIYSICCRLNIPNEHSYKLEFLSLTQILLVISTFIVLIAAGTVFYKKKIDLYRYRYLLAIVVFSIYVLLNINGTSLSFWSIALGENTNLPILGRYRQIRSDEYAVWSAYAIAQGYEGFPSLSGLLATLEKGGVSTLWESIGGIPAYNIAMPFKPLYWGFLIFGTERGFSWLWGGRFILLFITSFDFAMYYTKGNKCISLCASFLLSFAPTVQWFYSQSICEVLIFAQLILISYVRFFETDSIKQKLLNGFVLAWSIVCYIMVGFPAWLISVGYVIVALLIAISIEKRARIRHAKLPIILIPVGLAVIYIGIIIVSDLDTLMAVKNSLYPGKRLITGGNLLDPSNSASYRYGIFSLFLPLYEDLNQSEIAGVITFAPTGLVLACINQLKKKRIDVISFACIAIETVFMSFLLIGFPKWLAEISFLSQCNRLVLALGFADTVLFTRNIAGYRKLNTGYGLIAALSCSLAQILVPTLSYSFPAVYIIVASVIVLAVNCIIFAPQINASKDILFSVACTMICAGMFVNPVQIGISCVTDLNFVKSVQQIDTDDSSLFLFEGNSPYNNLLLLCGKKCISTTQVYPNTNRWSKIDPNGEYSSVYNRFGHINVVLEEGETYLALENNTIGIHLGFSDLKELGINYIITDKAYSSDTHGIHFTLMDSVDKYNIYKITY